jgi:biotin carboxylase
MKKILLLGGSHGQLPAIYEAKKRGLYTILCDYLPDNPGAAIADEFHLVSTTDKEAVLNIARERQIDFVMAYASDPAALTAAFVSETLGLPGNTVDSINTLADKSVFRQFLSEHGFNVPVYEVYDAESIRSDSRHWCAFSPGGKTGRFI